MDKNIDYLYVGHNGHDPKQYGDEGEYLCCKECGDDWPCQEVYRQISRIVNNLPAFLSGRSKESINVSMPELEGKDLLLQEMENNNSFRRFVHKLEDMLFNAAISKDMTKSRQMVGLVWSQYKDKLELFHKDFQDRDSFLAYEFITFIRNIRSNVNLAIVLNDQRVIQPLLMFHEGSIIRSSLLKKLLLPLHLFVNRNDNK